MRLITPLFLCVLLAACAGQQTEQVQGSACSEPRPQVCTMQYEPVCVDKGQGRLETYSSPCNACADDNVTAYARGACEDQAG